MEESARVLSRAAGPLGAQLMFIGEAPGRLGADSSEIPFHGDQAGHNFEELLEIAGLDRSSIFITNAVLCNPKADDGNNATPSKAEITNCSNYLKQQIDLVNPRIVVTLGSVALDALNNIAKHNLQLTEHVRTSHSWYDRKLIPLYHPGARARVHRSMANQRSDFQFVSDQLSRLNKVRRGASGQTRKPVALVAKEIIKRKGTVSYFGLHKLFFLVECEAWKRLGHRLTQAFFLRQKDGPYCTDLHIAKLQRALPSLLIDRGQRSRVTLRFRQVSLFDQNEELLPAEMTQIVSDVIDASASLSDAELKTKVYLTTPMRSMLRVERTHLINLYNAPIHFG
jgi:uracil-DNA glycosylase family 4